MPHRFTSRNIPKRTKSENLKKYLLLALLFTGAKKGEATQMSNRPTDKRTVVCPRNGRLFCLNVNTCSTGDEPRGHTAREMSQSQKDKAGMITVVWVPGVVGCRQEGEWWLLGTGGDRQRESVGHGCRLSFWDR